MIQLILHLIGDYVTQSHWMATRKTASTWAAFCHATVYSIPFAFIGSPRSLFVIWFTHLLIDRFRLARYVVFLKNLALGDWFSTTPTFVKGYWEDRSATGFHKDVPPWLAVWLLIAVDNTMHLTINYVALRYL
jgi:hypothetical protein